MMLDQPSLATSTFRKYRVLTELGCGDMGQVYLAVHQGIAGFNKLVVLKVLKSDLVGFPEHYKDFLREARVSARMNHPNVVAVNEVEEWDGAPVIVMEYLDGQPLSAVLGRMIGKAPLDVLLRILSESLSGLHYAHELTDFDGSPLGLVHRDYSPQNIFITYDGSVKVLDFGVAQITHSNPHSQSDGVRGKLRYMAPEQISDMPLDRRTDVFAAGIILSEVISGQRFWGDLTDSAIVQHMDRGEIPRSWTRDHHCPSELDHICSTALALDRESRYQTIAEVQQNIDAFLAKHSPRITTQDLGRHLSIWFQDERANARKVLESALSRDTYVSWSSIAASTLESTTSRTPPATISQTIPIAPLRTQEPPTGVAPRRWRHVAQWLSLAAGTALIVASGALFLKFTESHQLASPDLYRSAVTDPRTAKVRISAHPASASVFIDDIEVGRNPYSTEVLSDGSWHQIRVTAVGFQSAERRLQYSRDVELFVSLEPEDALPPLVASTVERRQRARRGPLRAPAAVAKPLLFSCSPPYTYDQRGFKRFKPECL